MRLSIVAAYLVLQLAVFIESNNSEALPKTFLRARRSLNPIQAIKNLLPERNVKPKINLVPVPPGVHPLWKVDKDNVIKPVPISNCPISGHIHHLPEKYGSPSVDISSQPINSPENELEPPPTEYDPPYYHQHHHYHQQQQQTYEPREPTYTASQYPAHNFPQYEAPSTEYGTPQEVYFPVNEYGPPKEPNNNPPDTINSNSGETNEGNSGAEINDALNALDAFGPLLDFLPNPSSDKDTGGKGSLAGIDVGALLEIISTLPEGTIEKLKALLGVYHAKNNQERLKNLFDAKNATLKLKSGALTSLNNFFQDTYKDHRNRTSSGLSPFPHGHFTHPFQNNILNIPSHNSIVNKPFPNLFGGILPRGHKAQSSFPNNILKHFQNHPFSHIQGIPIPGLHEEKSTASVEVTPPDVNSRGNFFKEISKRLFGNKGDFTDTAIEGSTKVINIPYVYLPQLNTNSQNKRMGPYYSIRFFKPLKSYSSSKSTPVIPQTISSSVSEDTGFALPSQEAPAPFNTVQSYAVPSSTSVNSYNEPRKVKFSVSQDDVNSFQPITSYGVPHNAPQENINPLFNEVNSTLPISYEDHNIYSRNSNNNQFSSYNPSNDIISAASERKEQEAKPSEVQISGFSRVSLQNSPGNAKNSSQTFSKIDITDDAEGEQSE